MFLLPLGQAKCPVCQNGACKWFTEYPQQFYFLHIPPKIAKHQYRQHRNIPETVNSEDVLIFILRLSSFTISTLRISSGLLLDPFFVVALIHSMGWTFETREPEHMLYMEVKFWSILRRWGSTICVPRWLNGCASLKQIRTNLCSMRYLLFVVSVSCSSVPLSVSINICWFTGSGCCTKAPPREIRGSTCVFLFFWFWFDMMGKKTFWSRMCEAALKPLAWRCWACRH